MLLATGYSYLSNCHHLVKDLITLAIFEYNNRFVSKIWHFFRAIFRCQSCTLVHVDKGDLATRETWLFSEHRVNAATNPAAFPAESVYMQLLSVCPHVATYIAWRYLSLSRTTIVGTDVQTKIKGTLWFTVMVTMIPLLRR